MDEVTVVLLFLFPSCGLAVFNQTATGTLQILLLNHLLDHAPILPSVTNQSLPDSLEPSGLTVILLLVVHLRYTN
jgi:hypothetical protein